jgi:hypothetical protein
VQFKENVERSANDVAQTAVSVLTVEHLEHFGQGFSVHKDNSYTFPQRQLHQRPGTFDFEWRCSSFVETKRL